MQGDKLEGGRGSHSQYNTESHIAWQPRLDEGSLLIKLSDKQLMSMCKSDEKEEKGILISILNVSILAKNL